MVLEQRQHRLPTGAERLVLPRAQRRPPHRHQGARAVLGGRGDRRLRLLRARVAARGAHHLSALSQRGSHPHGWCRRRGALRERALPRRALRAPVARLLLDRADRPVARALGGARPDPGRPCGRVPPGPGRAVVPGDRPRGLERRVLRRLHPPSRHRGPRPPRRPRAASQVVGRRARHPGRHRARGGDSPGGRANRHGRDHPDWPPARNQEPDRGRTLLRPHRRPAPPLGGPPGGRPRDLDPDVPGGGPACRGDGRAGTRGSGRHGRPRARRAPCTDHGPVRPSPSAAVGGAARRDRHLLHRRRARERHRAAGNAAASHVVPVLPRHPPARPARRGPLAEPAPAACARSRAGGDDPRRGAPGPDQPGSCPRLGRERPRARHHRGLHPRAGRGHGAGMRCPAAACHAVPRGEGPRGLRDQPAAAPAPHHGRPRLEPRWHERNSGRRLDARD